MNTNIHVWTKENREPFVEEWLRNAKTVEDYIENLVDCWHDAEDNFNVAGETVRLYDFLGLEEHEVGPWVSHGTVPDRITLMWLMGDY